MKLITIKQFEPGELTEVEENFYQRFSGTAAQIASENQGEDQIVLIAAITRALMQCAGNALSLAEQLGVETDV